MVASLAQILLIAMSSERLKRPLDRAMYHFVARVNTVVLVGLA